MGGNKPLSEFMSLVLKPVAKRMEEMEINAGSGLTSITESINTDISSRQEPQQRDGTSTILDKQQPGAKKVRRLETVMEKGLGIP